MTLFLPPNEVENGFQELQNQVQLLAEHPDIPLRAYSPFSIMVDLSVTATGTEAWLIFSPFFLIGNLLHKVEGQIWLSADGLAAPHTAVRKRDWDNIFVLGPAQATPCLQTPKW